MTVTTNESRDTPTTRPRDGKFYVISLFASVGLFAGLALGILEGILLFTIPRASGLLKPDTHYVVLFLAPLADAIPFAVLGFLLALPAAILKRARPWLTRLLAAIGLGLAGAYLAWLLDWFRIGIGVIFPARIELRAFVIAFLVVAIVAWFWLWLGGRSRNAVAEVAPRRAAWRMLRATARVSSALAAVCVAGILFYSAFRPFPSSPASTSSGRPGRPNIILIVMDTVRADHLSCYGYGRATTPFLENLAARGTLFEDAIAPTSWTLPALASIFTGLLPHQHGADWGLPMSRRPWTLARVLRGMGYETAGFSANPFFGLGGWGLNDGFDEYIDDSYSIRHNLAVTFAGQTIWQFLYRRLIRYNQFSHRDAQDVNRDVLRWYRGRSDRPYFLFINYMDTHRPYLPPAGYEHRFGRIPKRLLARISGPLDRGRPAAPFSAQENQDMIDGYDNSLAYLDARMGRLIQTLAKLPSGENTFVIVTADHGEGFGEHGTYDHGFNLYREVLHVPLIVAGPGVPAGRRIPDLVATRQLFPTVLSLASGGKLPLAEASLERFWRHGSKPENESVTSELVVETPGGNRPSILSLRTPQWHFMVDSSGDVSLYNWQQDPDEHINQADVKSLQTARQSLEQSLRSGLARSALPWRNLHYLVPLDLPQQTFLQQIAARNAPWPDTGRPIGSSQALFKHATTQKPTTPKQQEEDNLRSLPY
ncbi:MAG: sulfatase-like hydrolase/transferase [Terriglobia bacterium]